MGTDSIQKAGDRLTAERIIAARFGTTAAAEAAAQTLHGYIATTDICIFHNNAPGQHGTTLFGDHAADHQAAAVTKNHAADPAKTLQATHPQPSIEVAEQVEHAEGSAMATAAVAGVAAGVLAVAAGPVAALAAVGVAAYTGSLAGAMEGGQVDGRNGSPAMRQGGVMIAVHVVNAADQNRVVEALKAAGAADIERAEGKWEGGDWVDFDPLAAPELMTI